MARTKVTAELTGTVLRIEAAVGSTVDADDVVMFLEAMKMEIPVTAPHAGTVAELMVGEGDPVEEGDAVAVIEG